MLHSQALPGPTTPHAPTLAGITKSFMRIFWRFIISLILLIIHGNLLSQNYFPLEPGSKFYYTSGTYDLVQVISPLDYEYNGRMYQAVIDVTPKIIVDSSKLDFEGKTYYVFEKERRGMEVDTLYVRRDSVGNVYCLEHHSKGESLY